MNNPLENLSKKESRQYENILDFPRFIINEILPDWKSYQMLKSSDKRKKNLMRYIKARWKMDNLQGKSHFKYTDEEHVSIRETKFMDKTFYLVSGVTRPESYMKKYAFKNSTYNITNITYQFLEDGTRDTVILFVDPIREFYCNPRTIVSRDLKKYDNEYLESQSEKNIYSWHYKIYLDLSDLVIDMTDDFIEYSIGSDQMYKIYLSKLLVESVFTWYWSYEEDLHSSIVRVDNKKYNPNSNILMILKSLHIYPHGIIEDICMTEEFDKSILNTLKLTKVFVTDKFKNANVLERSMMIKEKEFEINHE